MGKNVIFNGSGVALVTPMNSDGKINYNKLDELISFHINNKTDAIIIAGTTGESSTLNEEEQMELIKHTVDKVDRKIPVIAGTGSNCTAKAIKMGQQAKVSGANALLIVTPYYNKTSQKGLIKHYLAIAESVNIPIIVYNVPGRTGMGIAPQSYLELSKHPNIVATKEASGDISLIAESISLCGDNLHVYSGNDDQTLAILSLGGQGVISVLANIMPVEMHNICSLFFDGKLAESQKLQLDLIPIMNSLFKTVNPIPIKEAMNLIGMDVGNCRLPLISMDESESNNLKQILKHYNLC